MHITHPRPQLVRPTWTSLDGDWEYGVGTAADEGGWSTGLIRLPETIRVPFAPQSALSGRNEDPEDGCVWYRRELPTASVSRRDPEERVILHFGAVDYEADVWVNGVHVMHHRGGQVAFSVDVTAALFSDGGDVVVVRAVDPRFDAHIPRGKQAWAAEPHFIWYARTIGIWRSVWIERVPALRVEELVWEPDISWGVRGSVRLSGWRPDVLTRVEITVMAGSDLLGQALYVAGSETVDVAVAIEALRNPQARASLLWSPESPTLLDVHVSVSGGSGSADEVDSYVGLRSIGVSGGRFRLNGRPYFMRAVLSQGYWPESHFTAPDLEALTTEARLAKDLGFNTVRVHQKVEDPRFLAAADRLGLLVWAEFGSAYSFSTRAVRDLVTEWMQAVVQQRSHPSVVCWVPFNESWGVEDMARFPQQREFVSGLTALTRALDGTRPVVSNDGWEHVDSDIVGIHDYAADPESLRARYGSDSSVLRTVTGPGPQGRRVAATDAQEARLRSMSVPIVLSEFGGIALVDDGDTWGYSSAGGPDALRQGLSRLFGVVNDLVPLAGYCYTQLTDTRQEANGLLWPDRTPKLPIHEIRAIVCGEVSQAMPITTVLETV